MPTAVNAAPWMGAALAALAACSSGRSTPMLVPSPMPPRDSIELSIFLVGDAGSSRHEEEPVLKALVLEAAAVRPTPRFIVFLGDNVYPRGIPPLDHPSREDAERRLAAQVTIARSDSGRGLLVPGNHDWDRQGADGWNAIRRQDTLVRNLGGDEVRLAPRGGCPGPEVVDVGSWIRLIALDTEWWLHGGEKPYGAASPCATRVPGEVADSLAGALRDKGHRHAIVLAHHPLRTGGIHGGAFTLTDHLFPLRNLKPWLWVPLPIIGSIYPVARQMGISNQDTSGKKYRTMRGVLEGVFAEFPPLAVASGHDHDLEVIRGGRQEVTNAGFQLVSGAGIVGHESLVRKVEGSLFRRDDPGFMRLDVTRDGRVRLSVMTVESRHGLLQQTEVFSLWLTDAAVAQ